MDTRSHIRASQDLDRVIDKVSDRGSPLVVKRPGKRPMVVMDLDDYRSMEETIHLMRSPANARRLQRSIRSLDQGKGVERTLIEPKPRPRRTRRSAK